jgi:hypothetical protein
MREGGRNVRHKGFARKAQADGKRADLEELVAGASCAFCGPLEELLALGGKLLWGQSAPLAG